MPPMRLRCSLELTIDVRGSRIHHGSDPLGANLIHVAFDRTTGIALIKGH
jgi:hypothetical protein